GSVSRSTPATWLQTSSSVALPSSRPRVNAKPELVVASAAKPSASSIRADPTSQGFGMTKGSPTCSAANSFALRCCLLDDTQHHLAVLSSGCAAGKRVACVGKRKDRIDLRQQLACLGELRQLEQLLAVGLD